MFKVWSPYAFHTDFNPIQIVRQCSYGWERGWAKQASVSPMLSEEFQNYRLAPDHTLVHLAPVAASEYYSSNVNGDGFKEETCKHAHRTFLAAHKFHEHDNQDSKKGTGRPVASAYNDKLHRIEILVDLDNKKNASILQDLEKGECPSWSMACKIDFDICNQCNNHATSPHGPGPQSDDPQELSRPKAGYCKCAKTMLGALLDNGSRVYVDNPHPHFFDISDVATPAEVIASTMRFRKAASASVPVGMGGNDLAVRMGLDAPLYTRVSQPSAMFRKLALGKKLAEMEKQIPVTVERFRNLTHGVPVKKPEHKTQVEDTTKSATPAQILAGLRAEGIILGLEEFAQLHKEASASVAISALPQIFAQLENRQLLADVAGDGTYDQHGTGWVPEPAAKLASALAPDLSLAEYHVKNRLISAENVKVATITPVDVTTDAPADRLLRKYAAYVLSELDNCGVDAQKLRCPLTALVGVVDSK